MNGGKDVKIGHDKRPISIIPNDEQPLYNISSGEILTDEFGNPLVTEVDQFFTSDASKERATSVVFPENPEDKYAQTKVTQVGISTATYGVDRDVDVIVNSTTKKIVVLQIGGGVIGVGISALQVVPPATAPGIVTFARSTNRVEVRTTLDDIGSQRNNLYFPETDLTYISGVTVGNKVFGDKIPTGSFVLDKNYDRVTISGDVVSGITTDVITFFNTSKSTYTANNVLKIAEEFKETSEVSTTLLGIDRAETQLSLFSNVSSYGLNSDDWESFSYNTGVSKYIWDHRVNKVYGKRYLARIEEETQESAIKLSAFPPPYAFPFGPIFSKIGLYSATQYQQYKDFILLGNDAYNYFSQIGGYTAKFANQFLNPGDAQLIDNDVVYGKLPTANPTIDSTYDIDDSLEYAFAKIDTWTDTWRSLTTGITDPVTGQNITFASLKDTLKNSGFSSKELDKSNTRPGYASNNGRYSAIQSRRVFRYQPGRISGFTFGVRSSTEPVSGIAIEWGISNETDAYVFKIYSGQLSIVRRSTVKLSDDILRRNGLDPTEITSVDINGVNYPTVQPEIPSGDPFDVNDDNGPLGQDEDIPAVGGRARLYHTIEIKRDNFNGDPLNGNGPSGYTIRPENVTMWKIEFGWYGAIGARFYAYIPAGAGEARWVVVHTLVIENQLGQPCLRDSYFRFKYSLRILDNINLRTPQFLYKYGASYYIDGGDEGTSEIYSINSGLNPKAINENNETSLFAIRPKDVIYNTNGTPIVNRKLIIPTKFNMTTDVLTEVKVRTCKGCQGHGHVFTPGVGTTISGRDVRLEFTQGNKVDIIGDDAFFTEDDIGAKLIAPSIFNAYIVRLDEATKIDAVGGQPPKYGSAFVYGWGSPTNGLDGYPNYNETNRPIAGSQVRDYSSIIGNIGITTTIGIGTYPHAVRLSNYNTHFASDFPLTGTKIKIQFMNPVPKDGISSYRSGTHWADFMIGITDKKPTVTGANELLGWDASVLPWKNYANTGTVPQYVGSGNTTILPESEILFGENTHSWAGMDENGIETSEQWAPNNFKVRMGEDVRIPSISSTGGGNCSTLSVKVNASVDLGAGLIQEYRDTKPDGSPSTPTAEEFKHYLIKFDGQFVTGITDWKGGSVVYQNDDDDGSANTTSTAKYNQRKPEPFIRDQKNSEYIELTASVKQSKQSQNDTNITILGRSVQCKGGALNETKVKLFTYDVYPLYLVGKLMDNSKINNIVVTEESLTSVKTTSPQLYITQDGNIDTYSSIALNDQTPPTNFREVERLSSASVDTQNKRPLRTSITKDIFYIGENKTEEIDMTKVFGIDRNVITPDNSNVEATFVTVKSLDGNNKFVQGSLNFREQ